MPRREDRQPLAMAAQFRSANARQSAALSDLSSMGCRIAAANLWLSVGQRIVLRPEGLEGLTATVRWTLDQFAGIEFDQPLYPAVVDHLCRMHPDESRKIALDLAA